MSQIGLVNDKPSALGEDTWWTWMQRTFKNRWFTPREVAGDVPIIVQNGLWGPTRCKKGVKRVTYCIDTFSEINRLWPGSYDWGLKPTIKAVNKSEVGVVHNQTTMDQLVSLSAKPNEWRLIPLGVNTELFKPAPLGEIENLRSKHGIPLRDKVGFWSGTPIFFKGWDRFPGIFKASPGVFWIIVWKPGESGPLPEGFRGKVVHGTDQTTLRELMCCSDFFLSLNPLRVWYQVEMEGMACDLPMVIFPDTQKEWYPHGSTRAEVFSRNWDRGSVKELWRKLFTDLGEEDTLQ